MYNSNSTNNYSKKGEDSMKKYLNKTKPEMEEAKFSVVPGKSYFTIVSNQKDDERRLYIRYDGLYYCPQLHKSEFVEDEILDRIQSFFPESKGKAVMLCYTKQYEQKCQNIAHFNLLEFD